MTCLRLQCLSLIVRDIADHALHPSTARGGSLLELTVTNALSVPITPSCTLTHNSKLKIVESKVCGEHEQNIKSFDWEVGLTRDTRMDNCIGTGRFDI